jgi:hypothetical protein
MISETFLPFLHLNFLSVRIVKYGLTGVHTFVRNMPFLLVEIFLGADCLIFAVQYSIWS